MIEINMNHQIYIAENCKFPDGTPKIILPDFVAEDKDNIELIWKFDSMEELFNLQCIKESLDNIYRTLSHSISLFMPYIPNARMDRTKDIKEVFTLKTFCNIINGMNFDVVKVVNAHSDVSKALINNCIDIGDKLISKTVKDFPTHFDTLMFPDLGASKRYSGIEELKAYPVAIGSKERDWKTGIIKTFNILADYSNIKEKDILIIDDISSLGTTFYFAGNKLKELGARNIYLYVTHCEDTVLNGKLLLEDSPIAKIYTTDSIFRKNHQKITVLPLPLF